jgi:hypothetical protein
MEAAKNPARTLAGKFTVRRIDRLAATSVARQ